MRLSVGMSTLEAFEELLEEELRRYLEQNGYGPDARRSDAKTVPVDEQEWFTAALRSGLVERYPRGRYWLPASRYVTLAFWDGPKHRRPRTVSLYMEGLVTVATAARLAFIHGWPKWCLGFETEDGAFDLIGRVPGRRWESLAGEAKSSTTGVNTLITGVRRCGELGSHGEDVHGSKAHINAHRKWAGLVRSKARVFFVFAPGRDWRVFHAGYGPGKRVDLTETSESELDFAKFS